MRMLSLFPQLLFLSPLAATLLRISGGGVLLFLAWDHWRRRSELATIDFIIVGRGAWIPLAGALVELIVAAGLILGLYTQAMAIGGALLALKSIIWSGRYPQFFPLSRAASILLLAVCLSLIATGAGAFAFDLPL